MSQKDRQFIEALARGLAILECLSRAQKPLGNGELSKRTGYAASTISRLTHTLMDLGYVRLNRTRREYELTARNLTLGYPVLAGLRLRDQAQPCLEELSRSTGETVALAIRDKLHIIFVSVVEGGNLVAVRLATGGRLRMSESSAGIALAAALPDDERRTLVARVQGELTNSGRHSRAFAKSVADCRRDGYAMVRNLWRPGVGGVSVPIRDETEYAALTIPVATGAVSDHTMRSTLAKALSDAAKHLGPALPA